jgi:hypothetical protein
MTTKTQKSNEIQLINACIPYLESFILDAEGFYPFAMIMNNEGLISSLYPEVETDFPEIQYLIDLYQKTIYNEYVKLGNEYVLAVICIDVFIKKRVDEKIEKKNGIDFHIIAPHYEKNIKYEYKTNDNKKITFVELS